MKIYYFMRSECINIYYVQQYINKTKEIQHTELTEFSNMLCIQFRKIHNLSLRSHSRQ